MRRHAYLVASLVGIFVAKTHLPRRIKRTNKSFILEERQIQKKNHNSSERRWIKCIFKVLVSFGSKEGIKLFSSIGFQTLPTD